jgi:hypothetical protein
MAYVDADVENEWGCVNLTRFDPKQGEEGGRIGISPDEMVAGGHDVFPEQAFIDAIWELYPNGLPPKSLSKEEKRIRKVATFLLNRRFLIALTYERAVEELDPVIVEGAREDAEALIALVLDGED